jgi:fibrillarin-like pre-rRNA processing protein
MKITKSRWPGVFFAENGKKQPATINLVQGFSVYGERLVKQDNAEYRPWDPFRSKIAASLMKGIKELPAKPGDKVLYLGAANGTTASYVSDIVGKEGKVFCVDIAPRVMPDLIRVCERKKNMVPILADANRPEEYSFLVDKVDFLFEDVASPDQTAILIKNAKAYLKSKGHAMIAIKARSIDVTKDPKAIFAQAEEELSKEFDILDKKALEPYEADHMMFLLRRLS